MASQLFGLTLVCLLVVGNAVEQRPDARRRALHDTSGAAADTIGDNSLRHGVFRSSPQDLRVREESAGDTRSLRFAGDNRLREEVVKAASAGEGKKKKGDNDEEDEDKKTLSQQIADGKYGLIEKEIYAKPPLRPGVISYKSNPEVPSDTVKNLGGLDAEEIWLAEDHVLVLRGGWFPNHNFNRTEVESVWPPIDDYKAPARQVKIPARPKVPPPFPVQLADGGPTLFIGPNGTKSQHPFPPPFFPFPPGDGFYPPPGNGSSYPPPPYPFPPPRNESLYPPQGENYPPPEGNFPPGNNPYPPYPFPLPPQGYVPFPNGSLPYGPPPPFLPNLPPGAAFLPPPSNQTEYDEDDPSIYYPPPYDFYYKQDNTTNVPPGPLVPGIILPPPPNFFAPLDEKPQSSKRPGSTPRPHLPFKTFTSPSPRPNVPHRTPLPHVPLGVYPPTASPRPYSTPRPPPLYYSFPPSKTTPEDVTQQPPNVLRPTVKRPYFTYVPVTTAQRKKKPRLPSTTPKDEYEYITTVRPVAYTTKLTSVDTPRPPKPPVFHQPQNVQLFHKGESPITARPYYFNDVNPTQEPNYNQDDNIVTSTPQSNYQPDGLSNLKDILYTTPNPDVTYRFQPIAENKKVLPKPTPQVTTVDIVKSIEYTTEPSVKYYPNLTKRPIYVKDLDNYGQDLTSTKQYPTDIDNNSVNPTVQSFRGSKVAGTSTSDTDFQPFQPNRTPKTTYFFYQEPQYQQGYVQDVTTTKPSAYNPPKFQYNNARPSPQSNFNVYNNLKSQEEYLLAQIAQTLRQPPYYYDAPNKQPPRQNYYNQRPRPSYYVNPRPAPFVNSSPRPGFYITRKPEYYPQFPYSFEDVVQSTEHPPLQQYNTTPRPFRTPSRLQGPDYTVQTSPKTVYEYSFQKQTDANNFVSTESPRPNYLRTTTQRYYENFVGNPTSENNQIYSTTTPRPRKYPTVAPPTHDPLEHYYTQDDTVLDDITKKYFTIFGQKLPAKQSAFDNGPTTPLPSAQYSKQPDFDDQHRTQIPLYDDIAVNYRTPRPPLNPDSEYIDPTLGQEGNDNGGGKLISYKLPGNEGGHFYFVTPQVVQRPSDRSAEDAYRYPVPARRLRTRRNKMKER